MLCDGSLGGCRVSRCPRWGDLSQGQPRVLGPSLSCNLSATLQDRTSLVANFANRAIILSVMSNHTVTNILSFVIIMIIIETLILDAHASLELLRHFRCKECIDTIFRQAEW